MNRRQREFTVVGRCGVVECRLGAGHLGWAHDVSPWRHSSVAQHVAVQQNQTPKKPILEPGRSTTEFHRKNENVERFNSLIIYSLPPRCL